MFISKQRLQYGLQSLGFEEKWPTSLQKFPACTETHIHLALSCNKLVYKLNGGHSLCILALRWRGGLSFVYIKNNRRGVKYISIELHRLEWPSAQSRLFRAPWPVMLLSISGGGDTTIYKGKLFQWLTTFIIKSFLLYIKSEFPIFQLVSLALHPTTLPLWEKYGSVPIRSLQTAIRCPFSPLFFKLNNPNFLSLFSYVICCSHQLPILAPVRHYLSCPGEPPNGHSTPNVISKCQIEQNKNIKTYYCVCYHASPEAQAVLYLPGRRQVCIFQADTSKTKFNSNMVS